MSFTNFKFEVDGDGIALVTWDMPGRSMNVIDAAVGRELNAIIEQVKSDAAIKGAVVASAKESFSAGADQDKIDISIVSFLGEGGSDADNVNRWRQQLQLPPMSPAAIATQVAPLKADETSFATIDIAGASARTLAAWTRRDGRVWFFKATGPNAAVEKEKANFAKFIESIRF